MIEQSRLFIICPACCNVRRMRQRCLTKFDEVVKLDLMTRQNMLRLAEIGVNRVQWTADRPRDSCCLYLGGSTWGGALGAVLYPSQLVKDNLHNVFCTWWNKTWKSRVGGLIRVQLPADRRHRVRQLLRVAYIGGEIPCQTASDDTPSAVKHNMLW